METKAEKVKLSFVILITKQIVSGQISEFLRLTKERYCNVKLKCPDTWQHTVTTKFSTFIKPNLEWKMANYPVQNVTTEWDNVALNNTVQHEFDVKCSYDWILKNSYRVFFVFLGALQNYCRVSSLLFYDCLHLDASWRGAFVLKSGPSIQVWESQNVLLLCFRMG